MSDAGSGGRFPFLRRNKNSDTPNTFPQSMDPIAPTTGEIHQVFAPSTTPCGNDKRRHRRFSRHANVHRRHGRTDRTPICHGVGARHEPAVRGPQRIPDRQRSHQHGSRRSVPTQPASAAFHRQRAHRRSHGESEKLRRGRRCFRNNRHARHRHGRHTIAGTRLHQPVPARQCGVDRTIARDRRDREKEVGLEQDDSEDASPWHAS